MCRNSIDSKSVQKQLEEKEDLNSVSALKYSHNETIQPDYTFIYVTGIKNLWEATHFTIDLKQVVKFNPV